jgi:hypothetical protein
MTDMIIPAPTEGTDVSEVSRDRLRFSLATLATAVLAGALIPATNGPGIGIPIVAVAVAGCVAILCRRAMSRVGLVLATLSVLLTGAAMVRAAEWVVVLDLAFAVALASYAVADRKGWWDMCKGLVLAGFRIHRTPGFLIAPLRGRVRLSDRDLGPLIRGGFMASILLVIFGALFVTADTAFAQIASDMVGFTVPDLGMLPARAIVGGLIGIFTASLVLVSPAYSPAGESKIFSPDRAARWREAPARSKLEWLLPLASLNILFGIFVTVQLTVLFGGRDHVLRTAGLSYAQYARSGFFQLVAVAALVLLVIGVISSWARAAGDESSIVLRVLLASLSVLTLVVLASALRRLDLYEDTFGFTRLRMFVHGTILWLGALFLLVLCAGVVKGGWLPRAIVALTACSLLIFTAIDPDRTIARHNVERFELTGKIDLHYLSTLSPDAFPELRKLPGSLPGCVMAWMREDLVKEDPWYGWNLARSNARAGIEDVPQAGC